MHRRTVVGLALLAAAVVSARAGAQALTSAQFVNGIAIDGAGVDRSSGSAFDRRLGFFSDLYYDATRDEWWALSDRGPGGDTLPYETRAQRFTLTVDHATGQVSAFQVQQTLKFMNGGSPLSGLAPRPTDVIGNAFDPEGLVVSATSGHLFVSDEYGPSLYEFDRAGNVVRQFATPANLIPRDAGGVPNFASDAGNVAGRTTNRGFEGLAVSPDGRFLYASLQSAMLDEGAGSGTDVRIVKFDVATGATLSPPDKNVYQIDLAGATDVSGIDLDAPGATFTPVTKSAQLVDLDADELAALGGKTPEKWEGLAVGPRLDDGRYLLLAGTDNDYSVTQNASGAQRDVWFDFTAADPYASSIQCPIGRTTGCVTTSGGQPATWTPAYSLLPGVLHAYTADITGYVSPTATPEPASFALTAVGLALAACAVRRRERLG